MSKSFAFILRVILIYFFPIIEGHTFWSCSLVCLFFQICFYIQIFHHAQYCTRCLFQQGIITLNDLHNKDNLIMIFVCYNVSQCCIWFCFLQMFLSVAEVSVDPAFESLSKEESNTCFGRRSSPCMVSCIRYQAPNHPPAVKHYRL